MFSQGQQEANLVKEGVWPMPQIARMFKNNEELNVPIEALQTGDHIIVQTSEMVPTDGVILAGTAWLRTNTSEEIASDQLKQVGDKITATDIVQIGQICVQVVKDDYY